MRVEWTRGSSDPDPEILCFLHSRFSCSSYFLFNEADVQSCLCYGCTNSCSLTPIHRSIKQCLFPLTCSQKVCSISLLLSRSLWIMYVTGICGNPWISAYQCKPSSHPLPLLNIRVFPALMETHLTSVGVLTGSNIVCPDWKVNAMAQLSSALLHWLWLSPHLSVPLTMTLFPCFNAWVIFHHEPKFDSLIHSSLPHCVLSLHSSLGTRNAAAVHALLPVVFKICVFLKYLRSGKA